VNTYSILNPPAEYVDFRIATHGKTDIDLMAAIKEFFKKNPETYRAIVSFMNWLQDARNSFSLPRERVEISVSGHRKGNVTEMMIYDIEYWVQSGKRMSRKVYMAEQGQAKLQSEKDEGDEIEAKPPNGLQGGGYDYLESQENRQEKPWL